MKCPPLRIALVLLSTLTAGCAAQRVHDAGIAAFDSGDYETGLADLSRAAKLDSGNLSYRVDVITRKEGAIRKLLAAADDARATGQPQAAEADYKRVLELDRDNARARIGIERLQADRRYAAQIARAEAALAAKQIDAADTAVRAILAEDPLYAPAVALGAKIDQARGPLTAVPHLRTNDNRPVTLQFRDAPTKMVFEVLARQTGVNFIFDKDVKSDGKTTIFVSQVPVDEAIDLILAQNQLSRQILSENMVLIYPSTPAKQKDYQDEIVHTFYLSHAAPKDAETMLKTVIDAKVQYIDERSGTLTLRDTPEHVRMAEKLITSLDQPEPEVIMEVEILEISHNLADQLGIDYPTNATFAPTPLASAMSGAVGAANNLTVHDLGHQTNNTITVSPLTVGVDLLKTVGDTNVLSSPRIRARNHEKAKILVGDRVPVITSGTSATTGGSYSTSSVQYLEVGLTLEVQPTIHTDGDVAIKMSLEVSSIANTLNIPTGNGGTTVAYQISTRNANTVLELKDGETQVLAGLISDTDSSTSNHIPGLGDLPILGRLFGSNGTNDKKDEIVLLITPHIIRAQPRSPIETTEFWYGTESQTRSAPFVTVATTGNPSAATGAGPAALPAAPGGVSFGAGGASAAPPAPIAPHAAPSVIESEAATPLPPVSAAADGGAAAAAQTAPSDPKAAALAANTATSTAGTAPPSVAAAASAAAASSAAAAPAAGAPGKPKVTLEGPDTAKLGDEISVAVKLSSGEPLGRVRAQVRFDAAALQLLSAEPGDLAPSGEAPKVNSRPGGVQLDLAGSAEAPVAGGGSLVNMRFRVVAPRPSVAIDTQVVMVGEDGVATAATAATPLKITVTP
jgi:general secretion pathway protein D